MLAQKKLRYDVFRKVIEDTVYDNRFTPDNIELEQTPFKLMFVYDDLKIGLGRHHYVEECAYLCEAFTQKYFQYFRSRTNPGMLPIALETEQTDPVIRNLPYPGRISGQLLLVKTNQIPALDIEMENGVSFIRKSLRLIVPYREVRTFPTYDTMGRELPRALLGKEDFTYVDKEQVHIIRAMAYVGVPEYWSDIIDAGYEFTSMPLFEPKNRRYLKRYYKYIDGK